MQTQKRVTPIYYNVEDVGKNIKQSKKRFTWHLEMDQKMFTFVLDASMISGKVKLTCNEQIVAMSEEQPLAAFKHNMLINDSQISIMAIGDSYEMRINNQSFGHILDQEKTKKEFIKNQQACEDFIVDEKLTASNFATNGLKKTIKLKIGSFQTGTGKGTCKSVQSEDWSKMMGEEANSFPNYFDLEKGGSTAEQVDFSKVSMKKKPVQSSVPQPQQQTPNLLDFETHVVEITPEQFCTMQQLFRTQVPTKMTPSIPLTATQPTPQIPAINANDFSTMQMLFHTQCGTPSSSASTTQTMASTAKPVQISINVQDFSTMQWMFKTMNLGGQEAKSVEQNQVEKTEAPKASSLLDQLLCPTATTTETSPSPVQQSSPVPSSFNMGDFNTMQMIFATNNTSSLMTQPSLTTPPPSNTQPASNQKPPLSSQQPTPVEFTTMANLFRTTNVSSLIQTQPLTPTAQTQQTSDPFAGLGLSNLSNNANTQNINLNDFGTMQMLFKTNGMGLSSSSMEKKTTQMASNELKENAVPFQFQF